LSRDEFRFVRADEAVLWFERCDETETLTCIFNLGAAEQSAHLDAPLRECLIAEAAEVKGDRIHLGRYGFTIGPR